MNCCTSYIAPHMSGRFTLFWKQPNRPARLRRLRIRPWWWEPKIRPWKPAACPVYQETRNQTATTAPSSCSASANRTGWSGDRCETDENKNQQQSRSAAGVSQGKGGRGGAGWERWGGRGGGRELWVKGLLVKIWFGPSEKSQKYTEANSISSDQCPNHTSDLQMCTLFLDCS